jgi:hypothetical protein
MEERAAKLLLKAVRSLPEREQDQVLVALFRCVPEAMEAGPPGTFTRRLPGPSVPADVVFSQGMPPIEMAGPAAMLPVRLPPELHERLRGWSNEQGFSMASVVRGLVERFLDEQAGRARRRVSGGKRTRAKRTTAPAVEALYSSRLNQTPPGPR